ncbi:hypothetical protein PVK06_009101 [Gossypium arboreum]|uniref:Protein kinase domain-containing protein n=1 Tax=Gossypium arboreum TaxID=29729 RepID=A0ABR0QMJ7_GOSAR|nr:hypothetical protein PVK06_009101 [Gossypium arboreum]
MCKKGTMGAFLMLQNKFSSEISMTYASFTTLKWFRVSNNSLTGIIPVGIWGLQEVDIIDVAYNQLERPITTDIKNAKKIEILSSKYNRFSGSCASISNINMDDNVLSGKIPSSLGSLPTLNSLNLFGNQLSRKNPKNLSLLKLNLVENLIGKGGSGNVYNVTLLNGVELAVKHIQKSHKKSPSTSIIFSKSARKEKEFDMEVQTLSLIRHVNVVKLYCSITNEDSCLLVYEYLCNTPNPRPSPVSDPRVNKPSSHVFAHQFDISSQAGKLRHCRLKNHISSFKTRKLVS